MYQTRDHGIGTIYARKNHRCYGMGLGIIVLDDAYPGFPGDMRNASGYPFPIQYEIAEGINAGNLSEIMQGKDPDTLREPIMKAAKNLEQIGCRAISAECGFLWPWQREIADNVEIPVFLSCLQQVNFAQKLINSKKVVGILSTGSAMTKEAYIQAGIDPDSNYVTYSAAEHRAAHEGVGDEFFHLWVPGFQTDPPSCNFEQAEKDFVHMVNTFFEMHHNIGALVLNCSGFQMFARAAQREKDVPIFSWGTLIEYAYSVVVHREYYGHV